MSDPGINVNSSNVPKSSPNGAGAGQEKTALSKQDSGLFKDKTFQAIYNAFQLGWSLYELKSRVLLASFEVELDPPPKSGDQQPQAEQQNSSQAVPDAELQGSPKPGDQQPQAEQQKAPQAVSDRESQEAAKPEDQQAQAEQQKASQAVSEGEPQGSPRPGDQQAQLAQQNSLQAFIDDLFEQAQMVNAPPQPSDDPTLFVNDRPELPEAASENDWLRSVWRALLKQIVDLYTKCSLDENSGAGGGDADSSTLYSYPSFEGAKELYPYLYKIDYAKFGMPATIDESKFSLPGIVYRALNCLTLLYTDPKKTLSPKTIGKYRNDLLTVMATAAKVDEQSAMKQLSGLLVKLLVTWDNYVREHLYTGGIIKNDEIELVAYEAGRSLASLPWGISVRTVVLEKKLLSKPPPPGDQELVKKWRSDQESLQERLYDVWQEVFNKRDIVHIQHQITALSQAMDDAYYNVIPGVHRPDPEKNKDTVVDDPHLPTRSIHAIRHSLDYWLRSIKWLGRTDVQQAIRTKDNSTNANKPPILTKELAHDLRVALIQQSDVWHALMTYEQNLSNFTAESVTLNILNDFMVKFEQAMRKRFSIVPLIAGMAALVLLLIVIVVVLPLVNSSIADYLTKPPAIIVLIGTVLAGGVHAVMNWLSKLRGILGTSGQAISDAFQNGYKQLLVEFSDLNYNVAVSNTLAAFFIEDVAWLWKQPSNLQVVVNDAYSFLTEIVWTDQERAEEIDRVANAAFGPLGAFIGGELGTSGQAKAR